MTAPNNGNLPVWAGNMPLDVLNQTIAYNNVAAQPAATSNQKFWSTPPRPITSATQEVMEFTLSTARLVNYMQFDVVKFPHDIYIEYFDEITSAWTPFLDPNSRTPRAMSETVIDTVPPVLPPTSAIFGQLHPQHSYSGHWRTVDFHARPTMVRKFRVVLIRNPNGVAPANTFGAELDYSLAIRNFYVGYEVFSSKDIPSTEPLPGNYTEYKPFASTTDLLGSAVDFSVRVNKAENILHNLNDATGTNKLVWKCDPQPIPWAVVNFYADVRDGQGNAQVLDRFYLDPVYDGPNVNLYYTNDEPEVDFEAADDLIPYPVAEIHDSTGIGGNVLRSFYGGLDRIAFVDIDNTAIDFNPARKWWIGAQLHFKRGHGYPTQTESNPIFDCKMFNIALTPLGLAFTTMYGDSFTVPLDAFSPNDAVTFTLTYDGDNVGMRVRVNNLNYEGGMRLSVRLSNSTVEKLRFSGSLVDQPAELPGVGNYNLNYFTLKIDEEPDEEELDSFMLNPHPFAVKPGIQQAYVDRTQNAILRFGPDFSSADFPAGFKGGAPDRYAEMKWAPIARDYVLRKGYLYFPPVKAKYWKFEFTSLVAEPYDVYRPIKRSAQTYTVDMWSAYHAPYSVWDIYYSMLPGVISSMQLGTLTHYADGRVSRIGTYTSTDNRGHIDTMVRIIYDARSRDHMGQAYWSWNYLPLHQTPNAVPMFQTVVKHSYEHIDVKHTQKLGYFVGLKRIGAYRLDYLSLEDTGRYEEHFHDLTNVSDNKNFLFDEEAGLLDSGASPYSEATSEVFPSVRAVRGLQFATQQSDPRQLLPDDDFKDPDHTYWYPVGDASLAPEVETNTILGTVLSVDRNLVGTKWEDVLEIFLDETEENPVQRWEDFEQNDANYETLLYVNSGGATTGDIGGIRSGDITIPQGGRLHAAARVVAPDDLTSPLYVQIVDSMSGAVLSESRTDVKAQQVTEWTTSYRISEADENLPWLWKDFYYNPDHVTFSDAFDRTDSNVLGYMTSGQVWNNGVRDSTEGPNLTVNPSFITDTSAWGVTNNCTLSRQTGATLPESATSTYGRITRVAWGVGEALCWSDFSWGQSDTAPYKAVAWVRPNNNLRAGIYLEAFTTGLNWINSLVTEQECPAGVWTKLEVEGLPGPNGVGLRAVVGATYVPQGTIIDFTDVSLRQAEGQHAHSLSVVSSDAKVAHDLERNYIEPDTVWGTTTVGIGAFVPKLETLRDQFSTGLDRAWNLNNGTVAVNDSTQGANLATNPSFVTNTTGWGLHEASVGGIAISRLTGLTIPGTSTTTAGRVTNSSGAANYAALVMTPTVSCTPGTYLSLTAKVRRSGGTTINAYLDFYDAGNNYLSTASRPDFTVSAADTWNDFWFTGVPVPANAVKVRGIIGRQALGNGLTVDITDVSLRAPANSCVIQPVVGPSPYPRISTVNQYDLKDSSITVQVLDVAAGSTSETYMHVSMDDPANLNPQSRTTRVRIAVMNGVLSARMFIAGTEVGTQVTATHDFVAHRWWRIRESYGFIYWETSPDGITWTILRSQATTFTDAQLRTAQPSFFTGAASGTVTNAFQIANINCPAGVVPSATSLRRANLELGPFGMDSDGKLFVRSTGETILNSSALRPAGTVASGSLIPNGKAASDMAGWYTTSDPAVTITRLSGQTPPSGSSTTTGFRLTKVGSTGGGYLTSHQRSCPGGATLTLRGWVRSSSAMTSRYWIDFFDRNGGLVSYQYIDTTVPGNNTWVQINTNTFAVPSNAYTCRISPGTLSMAVGDTIDYTELAVTYPLGADERPIYPDDLIKIQSIPTKLVPAGQEDRDFTDPDALTRPYSLVFTVNGTWVRTFSHTRGITRHIGLGGPPGRTFTSFKWEPLAYSQSASPTVTRFPHTAEDEWQNAEQSTVNESQAFETDETTWTLLGGWDTESAPAAGELTPPLHATVEDSVAYIETDYWFGSMSAYVNHVATGYDAARHGNVFCIDFDDRVFLRHDGHITVGTGDDLVDLGLVVTGGITDDHVYHVQYLHTPSLPASKRGGYDPVVYPRLLKIVRDGVVVATWSHADLQTWTGTKRGLAGSSYVLEKDANGQPIGSRPAGTPYDLDTSFANFSWAPNTYLLNEEPGNPTWYDVSESNTQTWGGVTAGRWDDARMVQVRIIQKGPSIDLWDVDTLSLYADPIEWEFSNDGGYVWYPATEVRNNPHGVLIFPDTVVAQNPFQSPGVALMWRVKAYAPNSKINTLILRPWYGGMMSGLTHRMGLASGGPNRMPYDHYNVVEKDPFFKTWSHPVPQSWWHQYRIIERSQGPDPLIPTPERLLLGETLIDRVEEVEVP